MQASVKTDINKLIYGHKKDILAGFLRTQIKDYTDLIFRLENERFVDQNLVKKFFQDSQSSRKMLFKTIIN
ncbi:MAG: hypothetical protein PHQ54_04830 [Candidatus Omnitrophica bacterium]|nr:hypothetical protein [Candidatus Omnitrophota bacterium]